MMPPPAPKANRDITFLLFMLSSALAARVYGRTPMRLDSNSNGLTLITHVDFMLDRDVSICGI
jgi:hypothetical protein